jgi:hypothetical protein
MSWMRATKEEFGPPRSRVSVLSGGPAAVVPRVGRSRHLGGAVARPLPRLGELARARLAARDLELLDVRVTGRVPQKRIRPRGVVVLLLRERLLPGELALPVDVRLRRVLAVEGARALAVQGLAHLERLLLQLRVVVAGGEAGGRGHPRRRLQVLRRALADGFEDVARHVGRGAVVLLVHVLQAVQPVRAADALHVDGGALRPAAYDVAHALPLALLRAQSAHRRRQGLVGASLRLRSRQRSAAQQLLLLLPHRVRVFQASRIAEVRHRRPRNACELPAT